MAPYDWENETSGSTFHEKPLTQEGRYAKHLIPLLGRLSIQPQDDSVILDLGCATGVGCVDLAAAWPEVNLTVIGVDLDLGTEGVPPRYLTNYEDYLDEREAETDLKLGNKIQRLQGDYTRLSLDLPPANLIVFGNNVSLDIINKCFYIPDTVEFSKQIVSSRLHSAWEHLKEDGILIIWSEAFFDPTIILKKEQGRVVNITNHQGYLLHLQTRFPLQASIVYWGPLSVDEKFDRDVDLGNKLAKALNAAV